MANQPLVSVEQFVESIRNEGIDTLEAINEFIDNSFDADAENIYISIRENENDELYLIIEDDGEGIPREEIEGALSFGGRVERQRTTTGKFGWGLSASAICQAPRTDIYTKHGDEFYYNYLDREEIKEEEGLPDKEPETPFKETWEFNLEQDIDSGTILILGPLDNPVYKTKDRLAEEVRENVARVHRKKIQEEKKIWVNGEEVDFIDPLMLMDGFDGEAILGKGENYAEIEPIEIETDDGETAKVHITISKLPVEQIAKNEDELDEHLEISQDKQGYYLIRNGREIGAGKSLYLYKKHPTMNYFRAEIVFPPELDEYFGVQTNKSRFSLDEEMRDKIEDKVEDIQSTLRSELNNESIQAYKEETKDAGSKVSEEVASEVAETLKDPDEPEVEEKEELEEEKEEVIEKIEELEEEIEKKKKEQKGSDESESEKKDTQDGEVEEPSETQEETEGLEEDSEEDEEVEEPSETQEETEGLEEDSEEDEEVEPEKQKKILEKRLEKMGSGVDYDIQEEVLGSGHFYDVKNKGQLIEVIINTQHKFYDDVYKKAQESKYEDLEAGLELFLFALAHAETQYWQNDAVRNFYDDQKNEWSQIMKKYLRGMEEKLGQER